MCRNELLPGNNCCGRRPFEAGRTDIVRGEERCIPSYNSLSSDDLCNIDAKPPLSLFYMLVIDSLRAFLQFTFYVQYWRIFHLWGNSDICTVQASAKCFFFSLLNSISLLTVSIIGWASFCARAVIQTCAQFLCWLCNVPLVAYSNNPRDFVSMPVCTVNGDEDLWGK